MSRRRGQGLVRGDAGAAGVEFALLLPLLALLLFGFFEMGRIFYAYSIVSSSVRDAARYAARLPANCGGMSSGTDAVEVQKLARTGSIDGTKGLLPNWTSDSTVTISVSCVANAKTTGEDGVATRPYLGRYAELDQIPVLTVTADVPFDPLFVDYLGFELTSIRVANSQVWTE